MAQFVLHLSNNSKINSSIKTTTTVQKRVYWLSHATTSYEDARSWKDNLKTKTSQSNITVHFTFLIENH